jgi:hypothetical protein
LIAGERGFIKICSYACNGRMEMGFRPLPVEWRSRRDEASNDYMDWQAAREQDTTTAFAVREKLIF